MAASEQQSTSGLVGTTSVCVDDLSFIPAFNSWKCPHRSVSFSEGLLVQDVYGNGCLRPPCVPQCHDCLRVLVIGRCVGGKCLQVTAVVSWQCRMSKATVPTHVEVKRECRAPAERQKPAPARTHTHTLSHVRGPTPTSAAHIALGQAHARLPFLLTSRGTNSEPRHEENNLSIFDEE
eukprot:4491375-Amphidinium_carterae.2